MIDNSPNMIYITNLKGNFRYMNKKGRDYLKDNQHTLIKNLK